MDSTVFAVFVFVYLGMFLGEIPGLPLAHEVFPGNTVDKATLRPFLEKIERLYGQARRVAKPTPSARC